MADLDPRAWHRMTVKVTTRDLDELGHVNNRVYLGYVELLARAHSDRLGMTIPVLRNMGVLPVVRRHEIDYRRPALDGDELELTTVITYALGVRATRDNFVRRLRDGADLVFCRTDWVWVDPLTGRPRPLPAEAMTAYGGERG